MKNKEQWTAEVAREIWMELTTLKKQMVKVREALEGMKQFHDQATGLMSHIENKVHTLSETIDGQWDSDQELQLIKFLYGVGKLAEGTVVNKIKKAKGCARKEAQAIIDSWHIGEDYKVEEEQEDDY